MADRVKAHIAALFTMVVWSFTFISTKILLEYMSSLDILITRTALGFIALCILRPRILRTAERRHELLFALAGLTGAFVYYLAENTALEFADASFVSVAVSTAPLFTAALGFLVLKDKGLTVRFVVGFVIAIAGIAIISFEEGPGHASTQGIVLCLIAALSWAVYSIIVKQLASLGYETIAMTKRIFVWGLAFMVIARLFVSDAYPFEALTQPVVFGNLAFLGILASAACFITWSYSVKHLGPAAASAYIYLQAPLSVVAAVLMLGDLMTAPIAFGIALVLIGLVLSEDLEHLRPK